MGMYGVRKQIAYINIYNYSYILGAIIYHLYLHIYIYIYKDILGAIISRFPDVPRWVPRARRDPLKHRASGEIKRVTATGSVTADQSEMEMKTVGNGQ